ncbi:hypothetical protein TTHERM_00043760 (macronuclear) [Tetrahymena thermophila SB210]|uniref:Uncharacterized protein n=1 Tax=Tetrahymena thermophila (strain SB210) TaxID=312017 RepID=Q23DW7_TETTS|nr:hypothetical protein TTHERM_00043760 [Tetrahymena thermophila SB210]EAR94427.2 hypothetical protein TTHERM_00043760 [Tetrahymena thermophila SB210]|eukprot:XP_001014569.2 hypothetical protein TTHERM_00043760 [Tetrahymena thermophila SB210]
MEEIKSETQTNRKLNQICLKHGLQIKYFCVEIQSIDSLLCETCYQEKKNLQGKVQILLFELIYYEVQKEISTLNLDTLIKKCLGFIEQVNQANKQENLYSQNQDIIQRLMNNLTKSYEVLNRLNLMKEKINCKIWSSYFVQAIQNKIAIKQIEQSLKEVEDNIHLIKNGYFKYHQSIQLQRAFLLDEDNLIVQDNAGNLQIYDSNNLQHKSNLDTQLQAQVSLVLAAFRINQKRIGILFENANLFIFQVQSNQKFKMIKRLRLKKVPQSIMASNNFLRLDYKRFVIVINAKNFKILQQTDNVGHYLNLNKYNFFEVAYNSLNQNRFNSKNLDIFKDQDVNNIEIHTYNFCLSCMQWICQKLTDKKKLLKYTNSNNRVVKIYRNGIKF